MKRQSELAQFPRTDQKPTPSEASAPKIDSAADHLAEIVDETSPALTNRRLALDQSAASTETRLSCSHDPDPGTLAAPPKSTLWPTGEAVSMGKHDATEQTD